MLRTSFALALLVAFAPTLRAAEEAPPAPREFRAVWVATVGNIDWPSKPGLGAEQQKAEALALLDRFEALKMNAVVLQVRTAGDALYESSLEPWSAVLSGKQGQPPSPAYDPLAFWVEEAHKRGLQLHAWFNPFRAKPAGSRYELHETHAGKANPEWVKTYGNMLWMDPGEPEARQRFIEVVTDVIKRYDVDGVHIDDYFYPYPVNDEDGKRLDFPDDPSWKAYQKTGGQLSRPDWRRENISRMVEQLYQASHEARSDVQVGISPFGIPRPGRPKGVRGFDQYESIYADAERWLREGWCDYWTPQLYWKIDAPGQPFRPLLNYWISLNQKGRHMWPGLSISRVGSGPQGYAPSEILGQIAIIRETEGSDGHVLFSAKALMANHRGLVDELARGPYESPALVPLSPWLDLGAPARPSAKLSQGPKGMTLTPSAGRAGESVFLWAVWLRDDHGWRFQVHPAAASETIAMDGQPTEIVISAVDRLGNMSERVSVSEAERAAK